jgi:cytochrome c peroxidase
MTRRSKLWRLGTGAVFVALLLLCAQGAGSADDEYTWILPSGFKPPPVPADNPMTSAKVKLGRYLFYDKRMSGNGRQACSSCHVQRLAFTDGRKIARGSTGDLLPRGSMSLVNVAWSRTLTWSNPRRTTLEDQMQQPMFGTNPVELGLDSEGNEFLTVARSDQLYQQQFREAFPRELDPFTMRNVIRAVACFERTIISARSAWDFDWQQVQRRSSEYLGPPKTSAAAQRGESLFFRADLACGQCHGGPNFNGTFSNGSFPDLAATFHNDGMPADVLGVSEYTGSPDDRGKFKAPTMRNIALTAPYMHDGRFATLEQVVDYYARGGSQSPTRSPLIRGFQLSAGDRADLLAFLDSLTDVALTTDPRFSDPWDEQRP